MRGRWILKGLGIFVLILVVLAAAPLSMTTTLGPDPIAQPSLFWR